MRAATHRENVTAAVIITAAVAIAAWLLNHRTHAAHDMPKFLDSPTAQLNASHLSAPPAAPAQAMLPLALNIELVELPPEPKTAPSHIPQVARAQPMPRQETPPPQPQKRAEAASPKIDTPPPELPKTDIAKADTGTLPIVSQPPKVSQSPKIEPPKAQQVVPLRAEAASPPPIVPLKAETPLDLKPLKAPEIKPSEIKPSEIKPLTPEPERRIAQAPPPKTFEPLRPDPPPLPAAHTATTDPPHEEPLRSVPKLVVVPKTPTKLRVPPMPLERPAPQERPRQVPPEPLRQQPTPAVLTSTDASVTEGRALLRIFEQGSGPAIQIQWPSDSSARTRLYDALVRCLGMRVGMVDDAGRLYLADGKRGAPSMLNTDRYSGFVRQPEGALAGAEQSEISHLRAYHDGIAFTSSARIFPRHVDAFLIGGLRQAVGDDYVHTKSIRAAYRLSGQHVLVDSITADGRSIGGAIDLSTASAGCSG